MTMMRESGNEGENINNTRRTHSVTIQGQQKREIKKQYDNRKDERGY